MGTYFQKALRWSRAVEGVSAGFVEVSFVGGSYKLFELFTNESKKWCVWPFEKHN